MKFIIFVGSVLLYFLNLKVWTTHRYYEKKDGKAFSLDDLFFILVMSLCIVCGVTYIMPLFDGLLGKCLSVFPLVSLYIVYPVVILYSIFELKEKKSQKETNKDEVTEAWTKIKMTTTDLVKSMQEGVPHLWRSLV